MAGTDDAGRLRGQPLPQQPARDPAAALPHGMQRYRLPEGGGGGGGEVKVETTRPLLQDVLRSRHRPGPK